MIINNDSIFLEAIFILWGLQLLTKFQQIIQFRKSKYLMILIQSKFLFRFYLHLFNKILVMKAFKIRYYITNKLMNL